MRKFCLLIGLLLIAASAYFFSLSPSLNRNWSADQAILPIAIIEGSTVQLKNVRNFIYSSTTEYKVQYYDTEVDLAKLETVDYIVEPFGDIGAAHTFVSFGFEDGQYIAVSVEIRKEVGETFSPLKGLLRQYELMYVIADERDVVNLRANHRKHNVYVYPTTATKEQATTLFLAMIERANKLAVEPEFYNTLTSNCTTNIVKHINNIGNRNIGWDYRLLLPEASDELAKELGFIAPNINIEAARSLYKINESAALYKDDQYFSKLIREYPNKRSTPIAGEDKQEVYSVSRVIDGDTIEVDIKGDTKRVRYIGIDTPEVGGEGKLAECFASEATIRNRELVQGKLVFLIKDVSDTDDYGRLLRYVYVDDIFVNEQLVEEGYAKVLGVAPDLKYNQLLKDASLLSQRAKIGVWSKLCMN